MSLTALTLEDLLHEASELGEGDEQISAIEEIVRRADLAGELRLQYRAREAFVRACIFGGAADKALVAFAWLLTQFDQHPGRFDEWAILWKYKWILANVCSFPSISKARIYEMLDDLAARSRSAGYGLRAATNLSYRAERFWDDRERAVELFNQMRELPRDSLSNCGACETDERVSFSTYVGDDPGALSQVEAIVSGRQKCGSVPHRTYANLLLPLIRLGRWNEAASFHQIGYDLISNNKTYLDKVGDHIIFLVLSQNFEKAIALVEKHFSWTLLNRDVLSRFRYFRAAWLLFGLLSEKREGRIDLKMPRTFPLHSRTGLYDPAALANWFQEKATAIAKRFDERNGTDAFAILMDKTLGLKQLSESWPIVWAPRT